MYLAAVTAALALSASPADATTRAAADLAKRPVTDRKHTRYLSLYHLDDKDELASWGRVLSFWLNSLSRESELVRPYEVSRDLWRIDLRDYDFPAGVWDKLEDPYFTAVIKQKRIVKVGSAYVTRTTNQRALAPWLDTKAALALAAGTRSRAAIVRADWFLVRSAQQAGRAPTGYYDFLGVKTRKEFQSLVGLDQKLAEKLQKETRAVVARSGVAIHNRQIIRLQTITGPYWATLDVEKQDGARNAVRNLNGDYTHDAEEIYGTLPNGLFAFFLSDAAGKVRQDSVPDKIASDHAAPGNDRRVHPGVGCVRCHVRGIQPIDDWTRRVYKGPVALASPDYEKIKRLRRLYLSDLNRHIKRDQADYAEAVLAVTGLKPEILARAFAKAHGSYEQSEVGPAGAAREAGVKEAELLAALRARSSIDPVLAGLLAAPAEPIQREHWEESFSLLMSYIKEHKP